MQLGCYSSVLTPRVPFRRQGYLVDEEPSGYFNSATEEALKRWQQANGITRSPGLFGVPGRALYAKARGPPDTCLSRHLIWWMLPLVMPADACGCRLSWFVDRSMASRCQTVAGCSPIPRRRRTTRRA